MTEQEFLSKIKSQYPEEDVHCIRYALEFSAEAHKGQLRESGEPYIVHPIAVAATLADLGMDSACVAAALMHDVLEDTMISDADLKKKFGEEIYALVAGVTKLSRIKFTSKEEEQAENYRKLFFAVANDVRVLFIKLADRLHNMRTLGACRKDKQIRIARETLDLYAPLAGRLGIAQIKSDLEDLSMRYLYPEEYRFLAENIDARRGERMGLVMRIANEIEVQLSEQNIHGEVKGRPKHFYSIYKKMRDQGKTLDQIYDLIAVRVIVDTVRDCYTVLGIIHSMWKPIPGRFKDYIAVPKPNLYQSLHTTVASRFGQYFEIQIRTYEMNKYAEYGIAAHWKYKEGKNTERKTAAKFDTKLGWIQDVVEVEKEITDSHEFLNTLKSDVKQGEIFVFTPKGDVFDLPAEATCVDFAYKIHSAIGNKCVGAKVNNRIVTLSTKLETGDMVEILTSNSAKGPSRDWLKFVKTAQAKAKIRAFFKKEMQAENIKTGRDMLEKEAKRRGYALSDLIENKDAMEQILVRYSLSSLDDMFASIGYGGLTTNQVLLKLVDRYKKDLALKGIPETPVVSDESDRPKKKKIGSAILIEGQDDFLIKLARCCNPLPGDPIIGYASRGTGVSVHRADCPNVKHFEPERLMRAKWANPDDNEVFSAKLRIEALNRNNVLNQIVAVVSGQGMSISGIEAHAKNNADTAMIYLSVQIRNIEDLEYLIKKLEALHDIISVSRGN